MQCPEKPEEGVRPLGTRVTGRVPSPEEQAVLGILTAEPLFSSPRALVLKAKITQAAGFSKWSFR